MFSFLKKDEPVSSSPLAIGDYIVLQSVLDDEIKASEKTRAELENTFAALTSEIEQMKKKIADAESNTKNLQNRRKSVDDAIAGKKPIFLTDSEFAAIRQRKDSQKFCRAFYSLNGAPKVEISDDIIIGRSRECGIVIPDLLVSRKHAIISRREDGFWLEDLGSTNGTVLDGKKLSKFESVKLGESCIIGIGTSRILFEVPSDSPDSSDASV
ncbi:MAG: FHA domain-containing protein [Treponema sp.]|nr:FHA domain-containing protein [Treponema sp.]